MRLLPAIDIRGGKAVRLEQGEFGRETVYADDPLEAARDWVRAGAGALHVVDLDGAREGRPVNLHHLLRIAREAGVAIQYGGGLRSVAAVDEALRAGARSVYLGTAAYRDPGFLEEVLTAWADRVVVAVDVRGGQVSVAGWTVATGTPAEEVIARMERRGVRRFLYTDAERDGTLRGPNLAEVRRVAGAVSGSFLYSGGVGSLEHLEALRSLRLANLAGVVAGKGLYEGCFTIGEANAMLEAQDGC
jgi:phosphoribosylformimino-5-aminoimidazole carboxamide ribotide isomerase